MTPNQDIQGNSWTDEPEIPNSRRAEQERHPDSEPPTKREGQGASEECCDDEKWEGGAAEQRPPSDS